MANAVGTTTITRLRTGDSLYITFKVSGPTAIFYDENGIITDLTSNNVKVTPVISSQKNHTVTINSVTWKIDDATVGSTYSSKTGGKDTDGKTLVLDKKFGSATSPRNYVFTMYASVTVNGMSQTVSKSFELSMVRKADNSYWGLAKTSATVLSSSDPTAILSHELYIGGKEVYYDQAGASGKYTVKWYKNGVELTSTYVNSKEATSLGANGSNQSEITIGRNDVDGAAFFSCKFFVGGSEVEADGFTIIDQGDELKIICPDELQVSYGGTATITPTLYNTKSKVAVTSGITWSVAVYNNFTNAVVATSDYSFTAATGVFSMAEVKMYYTPSGGSSTEFSPIVVFSATV